jgi:cell division protein FtsB
MIQDLRSQLNVLQLEVTKLEKEFEDLKSSPAKQTIAAVIQNDLNGHYAAIYDLQS